MEDAIPIPYGLANRPIEKNLLETWIEFFQSKSLKNRPNNPYQNDITRIANKYPEEQSLDVDYYDMYYFNDEWAEKLITDPETRIFYAERAIYDLTPPDCKSAIRFRPYHFLEHTHLYNMAHQLKRIVSVETLIAKQKQEYPLILMATFRCGRCGFKMAINQEYPNYVEPLVCGNESCGKTASQTTFRLDLDETITIRGEDIVVEDPIDSILTNEPYEMPVLVTNDLVQRVVPGQRIILNGILMATQRLIGQKKTLKMNPYILAVSFENLDERYDLINLTDEDQHEIIEFSKKDDLRIEFRNSIAPFIYGYELIKDGIVLQLFGGVEKTDHHGHHQRGDIHILLIGDPGLGKTQLLKFVSKVAPKGRFGSGKQSTAAGLTATAYQDQDGWNLEAGFLPKCDRGLACIDELDKMSETDRGSIHEAMEQQTISIAKATITATLNARCAILAAANPKEDRFTSDEILSQIDLEPTLLSRFGLMFPLEDRIDERMDKVMSDHVLNTSADLATANSPYSSHREVDAALERITPPMTADFIKKYVSYAKMHYSPILPKNVRGKITSYYVKERQKGVKDQTEGVYKRVSLTIRQVEDIQRLTEASARMRLSNDVEDQDVEWAIKIFAASMDKIARDSEGKLDIDMVMTGRSAIHRNKTSSILQIILENQKRYDMGCPIETLEKIAKDHYQIKRGEVHEVLTELSEKGQIFYNGIKKEFVITRDA